LQNQIEIFQGENNEINVEVKFENDTVWLSQRQMSELFAKDSDTIGVHIKNIYNEGELERNATTKDYSVVQNEGKRVVNYFNKGGTSIDIHEKDRKQTHCENSQ
jgi:hypothetical protein